MVLDQTHKTFKIELPQGVHPDDVEVTAQFMFPRNRTDDNHPAQIVKARVTKAPAPKPVAPAPAPKVEPKPAPKIEPKSEPAPKVQSYEQKTGGPIALEPATAPGPVGPKGEAGPVGVK